MEAADQHGGELEERAQGVSEFVRFSTEDPRASGALDWNGVFNLNTQSLQYLKTYYKDQTPEFLVTRYSKEWDHTFKKDLFLPKSGIPKSFTDHGDYVGTITTARWDKNSYFRTFEANHHRVIIRTSKEGVTVVQESRLEDHEDTDASYRSEPSSSSSVTNRQTPSVAALVDTIPVEEVATFETWLDELREEFGRRIPAFAQEKGRWEVDRAVEVIEATISGRYPDPTVISVSKSSVVVRPWSRNYVFLTYDLLDKRRIVAPFPDEYGRTAYRRWRSTAKGFDTTALAFSIEEMDSESTSTSSTDGLFGNRPEPFKHDKLMKKKHGNTATHGHEDLMNRVANRPQPSKIQKVHKAQKQRHGSMPDRETIDLISPTALSSRPPRERTLFEVSGTHQTQPTMSRNTNPFNPSLETQQQQDRLQVIREQRRKIQQQMLDDLKEEEMAILRGMRPVVE
ncbi:MAG: hypothetical protein Q9212_004416 [Teloschistes hypoglaucus]